ncbi:hypothetical protein EDI_115550 [Entamoeba dispar SAW760]|uniref:Uncharacterized protein n=1 Tax=Entamoeba dispar (strain ATCC PRA-260 / SAW760) TaxID=370354 RepID=B0EII7_ENTDS|nr:uncharacterized protein EDI_115550 [Entamoeba dispar SAW760]EDR25657.1 hypothetical protein EDI_115550 [Entamoeba dispar SAW760]|eukprot:EDR25657.1 hypothetical protein EDI_115550 [Entamoeba dispar SAW760]
MKKRSIPLSTLLDNAVGDYNPTPNIKLYIKIAHVLRKQEQTCPVLRLQLLNKLKSHPFRFIASLEVYYCLCLMEFLVVKVKGFDVFIKDKEFVKALEKMAQFDKLIGLFKSKPTLTQLKAMNLVQLVMALPQTEHYQELYKKYTKKGLVFPPLVYPEYDDDSSNSSTTHTPSLPEDGEGKFIPSSTSLLPKPPIVRNDIDKEIFSVLSPEFRKLLQEMSDFHELCKEPLKKSNLLRNGSLQIRHQLQCDEAFFNKAVEMQKEFKRNFNEYTDQSDADDEVISALTEEGRKIGHIVRVLRNEIARVKKLETKIEDGVGECVLAEVPSYDLDAMMTPRIKHPETRGDAVKIMDYMSHTKGNTLSRDDSVTESVTESESNSATPASLKNKNQRKIQLMPPVPCTGTRAVTFKRTPSSKGMSSVDTSRLYTGCL